MTHTRVSSAVVGLTTAPILILILATSEAVRTGHGHAEDRDPKPPSDGSRARFGKNGESYAAPRPTTRPLSPSRPSRRPRRPTAASDLPRSRGARDPADAIIGPVEITAKGDRKKAGYFGPQASSVDAAKWSENKVLKRLEIAPPR